MTTSSTLTTVEVKRGDVGVRFTDTLAATGFDFTGAAVLFLLKHTSNGTLISAAATVDTAGIGTATVHYDTVTGDLATSGRYRQEWEVTKTGQPKTFPSDGYNTVLVIDDLNP